jgi:hypothetical protein
LNKIIENERGIAKSSCNFFGSLLQIPVTWKYENRFEDVISICLCQAKYRSGQVVELEGTYHLREEKSLYSDDFTPENNVLSPENT